MKWWSVNMKALYPELTPSDVYSLRSGVSHSGRFGAGAFARVIFTPIANGIIHQNIIHDAFNLDAATFCGDIVAAAVAWLARDDIKADKNVSRNMSKIVRYYPEGLPPYIGGIAVVS